MKKMLKAPSWAIVSITLFLAVGAWVAIAGPDMVTQSHLDRLKRAQTYDPVDAGLNDLTAERRGLVRQLERAEWVETFLPRTLEAHARGEAVAMGWPQQLKEASESRALEVLEHPAIQPVAGQSVALGVFAVEGSQSSRSAFYGVEQGVPYCILVQRVPERLMETMSFPQDAYVGDQYDPTMLQACTWIRKYGIPGEAIGDWFELNFHQMTPRRMYRRLDQLPYMDYEEFGVGMLLVGSVYRGGQITSRACRAGTASACALEWNPTPWLGNPTGTDRVAFVDSNYGGQIFHGVVGDFLSLIQEHFGEEAMLEFWTSDQPFERAFEDAFGVEPREWTAEVANSVVGPVRAGPLPSRGMSTMGLLLALASALTGVLITRLRKV